jgi:ankyrin repeat protein
MRELSFVFREWRSVLTPNPPASLLPASAGEYRPCTPLTRVAELGDSAQLRSILFHGGSDPAESGLPGWPPLMWATRGGYLEAIRTLVRAGSDFDRADDGHNGWTPPLHAIHKGRLPAISRAPLDHSPYSRLSDQRGGRRALRMV